MKMNDDQDRLNTPNGRHLLQRSQKSAVKRLRMPFKSPLRQDSSSRKQEHGTGDRLHADIKDLQTQEAKLDQEIGSLQEKGYNEEELAHHITMLHDYNEIKDLGQMLIGRIEVPRMANRILTALQLGTTTKDIYSRYGLSLED